MFHKFKRAAQQLEEKTCVFIDRHFIEVQCCESREQKNPKQRWSQNKSGNCIAELKGDGMS